MGERLHDGERGWFPCRVVEDIKSAEIRAQNLRECERIQQAQGGGGASRGRWIPKNTSYTPTWTDQSEQEFWAAPWTSPTTASASIMWPESDKIVDSQGQRSHTSAVFQYGVLIYFP